MSILFGNEKTIYSKTSTDFPPLIGSWDTQLVVVSSTEGKKTKNQNLTRARDYLQKNGIKAEYVEADGPAGDAILKAARTKRANLIVMGGYGQSPLINVAVGSTVDQIMREFEHPILICR